MSVRLNCPAIITNPETGGIGIIHALSRAALDMIVVERTWPPLLGRLSCFPKRYVSYRPASGTLTECLLRLADTFDGKAVLFPSTDADLEELINSHARLAARYHVPATAALGVTIFEKNWQYDLAKRVGVPTPRFTVFAGGESPAVGDFRFPLIIKPSSRAAGAGERVFRLRVVEDQAGLDRCLEEIAQTQRGRAFQVAENIPGEPEQLYTVGSYSNCDGRVLRSYTGRKVSQHPYTHGMASIAESLTVAGLADMARTLLEAAHFHGISQVEFKFDARDQSFKLIEINGRTWSWIKLPVMSGVNLPLIQYYDLTGDPRLEAALAAPQDDGYFYVHDLYVALNGLAVERQRIAALRRRKTMVPAIFYPGEWRLGAAHLLTGFVKRWRAAFSRLPARRYRPATVAWRPRAATETKMGEQA